MALIRTIKALFNFLLIVLALLLLGVFALFGFVYSLFTTVNDYRYLYEIACSLDALGNVIMGPLFNRIWRTENGYKFGSYKETISKVLGVNKYYNTLTRHGRWWADVLNKIDKNHVEKASGLFLFLLIPFLSFAQFGEGRLGNLTENKAHGFGGMAFGGLVYEVGRTKNNWQLTPAQFQRKEAKNIYRTAIIGAAFAGAIEVTDYLKGGKPSFEDFGNTVGGVLTYAIGRFVITSILHDRKTWRRQGKRLR